MTIEARRQLFHLAVAIAVLAALLAACAAPVERVVPTGEAGEVPYGWADWCSRNPEDPSCPRPAR